MKKSEEKLKKQSFADKPLGSRRQSTVCQSCRTRAQCHFTAVRGVLDTVGDLRKRIETGGGERGGTGRGLIHVRHCQAPHIHRDKNTHNEGVRGSAMCVWFNYNERHASEVDSTQVHTGKTGCHQSVSSGLPQLGHRHRHTLSQTDHISTVN